MKTGIYEKYRLFAFLLASILPCSVAQQNCTASMRNVVVYEGSSTSFTKAPADTGLVQWSVAPSSSSTYSINPIDPNSATTSSSYQVTSTQLTILDATSTGKGSNPDSTAGLYLMSTVGGDDYCQGAGLTVIISGPNCSYDDTGPNNAQLTCSVEFANYVYQGIRPVMTWTSNNNGATVAVDTPQSASLKSDNPGLQKSISRLQISNTDTTSYGCIVTFSAPSLDLPRYIDPNAPSFSAACVASKATQSPASTVKRRTPGPVSTSTTTPSGQVPSSPSEPNPGLTTTTTPTATVDFALTSTVGTTTTTQSIATSAAQTTTNVYPSASLPETTATVPHKCTDNLTNTVVYEGSPASFRRLNNNQSVLWQVAASSEFYGAFKNITNYDDDVTAPFASAYAINQTELTIFSSTVVPQQNMNYSTAGLYILRYRDPVCNYAANLIVIRNGPVCACNASDPSSVQLLCSVDFARTYTQPNPPVFTWKNGTSTVKKQTPLVSSVNSYVKRATSYLQITSNEPTTFECQLTFGSPPRAPHNYITTTVPDFTASCFISRSADECKIRQR